MIDKIKSHRYLAVGLGISLVLLLMGGSYMWHNRTTPKDDLASLEIESPTTKSSAQESSSDKPKLTTQVVVDVKGAVSKPGVYELGSQARVQDAITKAGGMTSEADPKSVNLAQKLKDEQVLYVARQDEGLGLTQANSPVGSASSGGQIDLNTADMSQLQTISGIGAKKAQKIIDYREQNGPFSQVEDLIKVPGFGQKTVEQLKDYLKV